jgi:hypothetical protein
MAVNDFAGKRVISAYRSGMRVRLFLIVGLVILMSFSCVPVEKIARHEFDSGFYKLKRPGDGPSRVYTTVTEDSIAVYPVITEGKNVYPDNTSFKGIKITNIKAGGEFYRSSFMNNSVDIDLTTVILKYRPPRGDVPNQLSSNINAAIYFGLRKDFYKVIPYKSPLHEESSYIRQIGFDAGIFAGLGITFMNPTVTMNAINQEYDGIVVQKGVAGFITFDNMSVGLALGFDNLLDKNKTFWIYNQKPYLGIVIGISNF